MMVRKTKEKLSEEREGQEIDNLDQSHSNVEQESQDRQLGQKLRKARQETKLSIGDVAKKLFIQSDYLQAIEEGNYDVLPSEPYRSGFIKSYASYLKLDVSEVMQEYRRSNMTEKKPYHFPEVEPEIKKPKNSFIIWAIVFLIVLYMGWFYMSSYHPETIDSLTGIPERLLM